MDPSTQSQLMQQYHLTPAQWQAMFEGIDYTVPEPSVVHRIPTPEEIAFNLAQAVRVADATLPRGVPTVVDPRALNCRAVTLDASGLVTGVELVIIPMLNAPLRCTAVAMIDEAHAGGQTTATALVSKAGRPILDLMVWLAYPYDGSLYQVVYENKLAPGNTNYPPNHVIVNGYDAWTTKGPLVLYVGDTQGNIKSDIVAGLGLPWKRHISFNLAFEEGSVPDEPATDSDVITELRLLRQAVEHNTVAQTTSAQAVVDLCNYIRGTT